jgi:integral membrane protein
MSALDMFRKVSLAEGCSALLLFLVAMPMKYLMGNPVLIKPVGMVHGILFLVFLVALVRVWIADKWPLSKLILGFVAGNVPFGAFWFERRLRAEDE